VRPSLEALRSYSRDLATTSRLSAEEQDLLARRFAKTRSPEDRRRLVLANLRLVITIAKSVGGSAGRPDFMDLVQEGNAGLIIAIERFDPERGLPLSAYVSIWVRALMLKHLMGTRSAVRATSTREGRRQFFERTLPSDVPLDPEVDHFHDDEALRPDRTAEASDEKRRLRDALIRLEDSMTARDRAILSSRLLSEEPVPLRQLGPSLGISGERVRQLEQDLMSRIRTYIGGPGSDESSDARRAA
jgi:RNA polymerase sigma-32 factor